MRTIALKFFIVLFCFWLQTGHAVDRIWISARINGRHARLCFDTGASVAALWGQSAKHFGLKVTPPPTNATIPPGQVPVGLTEKCKLKLLGQNIANAEFDVINLPNYLNMDFDGVIGWSCVSNNIFQIDAARRKIMALTKIPRKTAAWLKIPLRTNIDCLYLDLPGVNNTDEFLQIDTGDTVGVAFNPEKWSAWKFSHSNQPMTLHPFYMPGSGLVAKEEAWAREVTLGPLILSGVPVTEASPSQVALGSSHFVATLGMAALKRMDVIIDGIHGMAYLHPKKTRPPHYEHNRAGAVALPASPDSDHLIVQVVEGGPAYEAGVRTGDELLRFGKNDVTHWRTDPQVLVNDPYNRRAGAKINVTLKRGGQTYTTTVVLRDILKPDYSRH